MKKPKGKKHDKPHIKQQKFKDRNISPLESHKRRGKTFQAPFSTLPAPIQMRAWNDECVPNILWACILASLLERREYLRLFRKVIINTRENVPRYEEMFVTHNYIATFSDIEFDEMFATVLANDNATQALRALRLVDCLPDRPHWDRHLPEPDPERDWNILFHAVADCFDHQSERATDIRWLKIMYMLVSGQLVMPESMEERLEELRLYPDKGDMRQVRPSIRATEIMFRGLELGEEEHRGPALPPNHRTQFWSEMKAKTGCIFPKGFEPPKGAPKELREELIATLQAAQEHFDDTIFTTAADPRHDGAFGLVLFALTLLFDATTGWTHTLVEGRLVLRTIVEAFITLHFLRAKDDPVLWLQYRRFGSGQGKLAFLKNVRQDEVPEFFDLEMIERLANEDMWLEFHDVEIGNWANLNLRTMAEQAEVKDVYDKFYDWSSGYSHGHWLCVRDTVFVNCMNPLHRFHRIPGPPVTTMPSVLPDGCKLINRMLDDQFDVPCVQAALEVAQ
jgi:hypothetical protein